MTFAKVILAIAILVSGALVALLGKRRCFNYAARTVAIDLNDWKRKSAITGPSSGS